jgi:hypothetical protein
VAGGASGGAGPLLRRSPVTVGHGVSCGFEVGRRLLDVHDRTLRQAELVATASAGDHVTHHACRLEPPADPGDHGSK